MTMTTPWAGALARTRNILKITGGRLVKAPEGALGRYVRLYSNGNTANEMNHYIEVEVFGLPAQK